MLKMKQLTKAVCFFLVVCIQAFSLFAQTQPKEDSFFNNSLHHTNRGIEYWYRKENNGIEALTGIPFENMDVCHTCHVPSCDRCHMVNTNGKV